jgi:hypothetical protein
MVSSNLNPIVAEKHFNTLFKIYKDLNRNVYKDIFFGNHLYEKEFKVDINFKGLVLHPILFGQMATLFNLCPLKYEGILNHSLLDFLGHKFHKNVLFLLTADGFIAYVMIMQTNKDDRIAINNFFGNHIEDLYHYQYYSSEYNPIFEQYKLLWAKTHKYEKNLQDLVLTFT